MFPKLCLECYAVECLQYSWHGEYIVVYLREHRNMIYTRKSASILKTTPEITFIYLI